MAKFIDNARRLPQIYIETSTEISPVIITSSAPTSTAIYGFSTRSGVHGQVTNANAYGIYAQNNSTTTSASGAALRAQADSAYGAYVTSNSGTALYARSSSDYGIYAASTTGYGVYGESYSSHGVYGLSLYGHGIHGISVGGWAGYFDGNINVTGNCTGCLGPSRIDDPTDPAHKYLYHSPVQSSEMLDIYAGHVTLDTNGEAWADLPSWFQALNTDLNYQLTCIGGYAPVYISQEVRDNRFQIAGGKSGLKVSWQITGVRHDPYSQQHPVPVQQDKPPAEQGTYLHPELYSTR